MWQFSQAEFPGMKGIIKTWKRFLVFIALVGVVALLGAACGDGDSADKVNTNDDGHTHATDAVDAHPVERAHQVRPLRPSDVGPDLHQWTPLLPRTERVQGIGQERLQAEQRLKRLGRAYVDGLYSDDDYKREKHSLEDSIAGLVVPGVDTAKEAGEPLEALPSL